MKTHYSYFGRIDGVDSRELDVTCLRSTNLVKSKFILVANDLFDIFESQIKVVLPVPIVEVDGRKEMFSFSCSANVKEKLVEQCIKPST
ncbi:hypothetical protein AVEN_232223-1 [Araneus ventricosus]|uniref:Uncharacterized protein n=1 Tax=Araneus ventricosus TaxID=182803 RepID=A0A4Y2RI86_ARAVE|nr:hypothetical protein AVEN_232223-1 [Araneus ventricosus]